jgi:GR25 family glycosyltransferase involved in LPS biosynthesis
VVFNRIDTVKRTFEAIRKAAPSQLFVAADGPRDFVPQEQEKCQQVRDYIQNNIDWDCEVKTRFLEKNLGCRKAVSSAVDWFFSEVEEGIILEDDCLAGEDFFRYAAEALAFYRNDTRVMHINGSTFFTPENANGDCSYFYRYAHIWGWASWRRAWKFYDVDMKHFDPQKTYEFFPDDRNQAARWNEILKNVIAEKPGFNTWDFQWTYTVMVNHGHCLMPVVNLISNIGTEQSTHDMSSVSDVLELKTCTLPEKLQFPTQKNSVAFKAEEEAYRIFYKKKHLVLRVYEKLLKMLSGKK